MKLRCIPDSLSGLIVGIIVIAVVIALEMLMLLPPSNAGAVLIFAGGLTAGLITRCTIMRGALNGLFCGLLVVAILVVRVVSVMDPAGGILPVWMHVGGFALITGVIFVPGNVISGIIGVVIRQWLRKEPRSAETGLEGTRRDRRLHWIGIIAGACIVAATSLLLGSLSLFLIVPPLAAGLVAGFLSPGGIREGFISGLITGILGIGILSVPLLWFASQGSGFVQGLAGVILLIVAVIAIPVTCIGGILGAVAKKKFMIPDLPQ